MDAKQTLGEPRVLISRSALLHNAALLRRALPPGTRLCAILKADAYGHGAYIVADALCNYSSDTSDSPAVDALAVANVDEAAELPDVKVPIIVFRPLENAFLGRQRAKLEEAIQSGWVLTLCSNAAADDLARIAVACEKRASVQVMVDTGMTTGRRRCRSPPGGCSTKSTRGPRSTSSASARTSPAARRSAHYNHTLNQLARFRQTIDPFAEVFRGKVLRHAANSGGIFFLPASHLDMVRPGISLYGIDPTAKPSMQRPLRPVMKWTAPLVGIRHVRRGVGVGYAQTWHAPRDTRIGLIPCGYADGLSRQQRYSNQAVVLIHGQQASVVGRVSMDLTTVDLGDIPQAQVGDEATLLDNDPLSPVSAYALAKWADTLPYEVFCRVGKRVPRVAVAPEGWGHVQSRQPISVH